MEGCVRNPKFVVFINGRPKGRIAATRSLRQVDPLSPFLFLLVHEVFSALLGKSLRFMQEVFMKGFKLAKTMYMYQYFNLYMIPFHSAKMMTICLTIMYQYFNLYLFYYLYQTVGFF